MDQVIKILVERLAAKGMVEDEISAYLSTLWLIFTDLPVQSCQELNLHMRAWGWPDFELDEDDFKMFSAAFTN